DRIISTILPAKDVDGFHPVNLGRIMIGKPIFLPCTPRGILSLLSASGTQLSGAHVVIVGRSRVVGLPLANMLLQRNPEANATVTVCHRATRDLGTQTRGADVLIVAAGQPEIIRGTMVKKGAVVIDVGVNRISAPERSKGYRLVGDVAFDEVKEVAGAITPVPGGVGPMTIAMLMQNTVEAAERASEARGGAA
ncbi:MAG TPA: bifunctional 5,10-methylenetetrahydrofolate dehydrogenase/5,10-methenyltetrahydrofolate cyclohydrolase, partial [Spirochaetia bacterium]|nr:bifunctional 5,10-methylenetetrahydrofolate dehydrogenase/5,10-methenyltetrahydrofolate cyclohydrolase [Spirochaetia bacterium]